MPLYPTPHSEEWFRALNAFNPQQAAATRRIIELAGRTDACSICGDHPANDYKLVGKYFPSDAVATIRLCDDCRSIRKASYGEEFEPLAQ
jgi:hypothetical protein